MHNFSSNKTREDLSYSVSHGRHQCLRRRVWSREALLNPDLAAAVILSFRQQSRHATEAEGDAGPSTYGPTRPLEWGRRIKRSRMLNIPWIFPTTVEEEEEQLEKKKGKRRASPQSPLEGV